MTPHGTRARYARGKCRCLRCRAANTAYQREYAQRSESRHVDASEAREHLLRLSSAGIGHRQVRHLSGIGRTTIGDIASGRHQMVRRVTAEAILAIALDDHVFPRSLVDSEATRERIAEMRRLGLTRCGIARALGYKTEALQINERTRVTVRNARRVELLHRLALRELAGGA